MSHRYSPRTDPETGEIYLPVSVLGRELLENPLYNKGTVWPQEERKALRILGLLPPHVSSEEEQMERAYHNYRDRETDIAKYDFLEELHDRNEVLYYKLLLAHSDEMLPIVYTPTVGEACQKYSHIYRKPRGLYIAAERVSQTAELIRNAADRAPVEVAVVTDGERILGLGDQGAGGMGIPIGKLALYVLAGGFHPVSTLPILLDVGTDREDLLDDPLYLGRRRKRIRGEEYYRILDEFVAGFEEACPGALLQWEDFARKNAFPILERYRDRLPCFNDDIQGTGGVTLAGIFAAMKALEARLEDQRFLFVGAGEAGVGISRALHAALQEAGAGRESIFLYDSSGLVTTDREAVDPYKTEFATAPERLSALGISNPNAPLADLVAALKPTVLIGSTGQPGIFTEAVVRAMAAHTPRPVIFPLSNPTSKSEVKPQDAAEWTEGRALVATGSPFPPVKWQGEERPVGQCNNLFVFPAVGLGLKISRARRVTDSLFTAAAKALAGCIGGDRFRAGALFPKVEDIRRTSAVVAAAVAEEAVRSGVAPAAGDVDWAARAREAMWVPRYLPYRQEP